MAQDEQGVVSKAVVCVEWEVVAGMETEAVVHSKMEAVVSSEKGMESEEVVAHDE